VFRFSAGSLGEGYDWAAWRNLENFLLHFRNLIEFFGKNPTRDDLSISKPEIIWPNPLTRPTQDRLNRLHRNDLWEKYEVREANDVNDKISRYLQHCTEQRVETKDWNPREMFAELDPVMTEFENLLPDKDRPWAAPPRVTATMLSLSLSTATAQIHVISQDVIGMTKEEKWFCAGI